MTPFKGTEAETNSICVLFLAVVSFWFGNNGQPLAPEVYVLYDFTRFFGFMILPDFTLLFNHGVACPLLPISGIPYPVVQLQEII